MTWKRNVFFCNWSRWPEKRTYFFVTEVNVLKKERIFVKLKSMSWKKTYFFTLARESLKENVLFVPEKKTNFLQKQSKLLPNWRKCSPKWNQTPLQEKAWMKTYFLCLKRKRIFLQKQAKFHPNQRKCSPKGNKIQPEKERIFCAWKENVFFCESKQKFSPTGENFHSKETKHTWRSHQVPGSQVKYLRRERIVWYSRTIWNVEHAIQWEHFELSKVDMWKCSEETYTLIF